MQWEMEHGHGPGRDTDSVSATLRLIVRTIARLMQPQSRAEPLFRRSQPCHRKNRTSRTCTMCSVLDVAASRTTCRIAGGSRPQSAVSGSGSSPSRLFRRASLTQKRPRLADSHGDAPRCVRTVAAAPSGCIHCSCALQTSKASERERRVVAARPERASDNAQAALPCEQPNCPDRAAHAPGRYRDVR